MGKKLDGIKKLSGKELAESRKIVLDTIGEHEFEEKRGEEVRQKSKTLDSVSFGKKKENKRNIINENQILNNDSKRMDIASAVRADGKKNVLSAISKADEEKIKIQELVEKKEADVKKVSQAIENEKKLQEEKIKIKEQQKIQGKKELNRQAEDRRAFEKKVAEDKKMQRLAEQGAKKKLKEDKKAEKEFKTAEEKKRKEEAKAMEESEKRIRRKKERLVRDRARKKFLKRLRLTKERVTYELKKILSVAFSWSGIKRMFELFALSLIWVAVISVFCYMIFALLVLKSDFMVIERVAMKIPVPAVFSKLGFLDYNEYGTIKRQVADENGFELRKVIIKEILLDNLIKKYDIKASVKSIEFEINKRLVLDKNFNRVAFLRIGDINNILGEDNLPAARDKADSFGKISDSELREIQIGKIGSIIAAKDGYYVTKGDDYFFIKAATFADYLEDQYDDLKIFSLAD